MASRRACSTGGRVRVAAQSTGQVDVQRRCKQVPRNLPIRAAGHSFGLLRSSVHNACREPRMRRTSYARVTADTQTLQTCLSDGVTLAGRYPRDWESTRPRASTASNTPYTFALVLGKRLGFTASDLAHLRAPATLHLPPCCTWCEQVFNRSSTSLVALGAEKS